MQTNISINDPDAELWFRQITVEERRTFNVWISTHSAIVTEVNKPTMVQVEPWSGYAEQLEGDERGNVDLFAQLVVDRLLSREVIDEDSRELGIETSPNQALN